MKNLQEKEKLRTIKNKKKIKKNKEQIETFSLYIDTFFYFFKFKIENKTGERTLF
jgi:hypothetical protein